ncbi:MAG TPA: tRNA-dihydrouridine synthase family protein [Deltaproteobacteria bacterium]|nr:tRNA-dihydrouridine synthase family protein [Deltaproteobacteria bacterium]
MLAPMQGLTNRALRGLFAERYKPDVLFTEFVRVGKGKKNNISANDRLEAAPGDSGLPLVVQLIGNDREALGRAALLVQELGAVHLNINLGCPFGRMGSNSAGGSLLRDEEGLANILGGLRPLIAGSFSVKFRAGFDDPGQTLSLVKLFEDCGVDYLILHPRTVAQQYSGRADHRITAEVVKATGLPVIANGDIFTAAEGHRVLAQTGAAGLMLGRGAIGDPFLFARLRGNYPAVSTPEARRVEVREYLQELLRRYQVLFCGERQILAKMKDVIRQVTDPELATLVQRLKKSKTLLKFEEVLADVDWD